MTCVFLLHNISTDQDECLLGHDWPCQTDSTICGDYEISAQIPEQDRQEEQ